MNRKEECQSYVSVTGVALAGTLREQRDAGQIPTMPPLAFLIGKWTLPWLVSNDVLLIVYVSTSVECNRAVNIKKMKRISMFNRFYNWIDKTSDYGENTSIMNKKTKKDTKLYFKK